MVATLGTPHLVSSQEQELDHMGDDSARGASQLAAVQEASTEAAGISLAAAAENHQDPAIANHTATSAVIDEDNEGSLTPQQPETVEASLATEAPGMPEALAGALLSDDIHYTCIL